jgi:membrane peptidoglycan carboxypeptidase
VTVPFVLHELRTSNLQARYLSDFASEIGFEMADGPSPTVRFPTSGPFDRRLGYTDIARMTARMEERGFLVTRQAQVSERFARVVDQGIFPVYREKAQGGLVLRDRDGDAFHRSPSPERVYPSFESMPELLWRSLLFIENREFLDPRYPRRNPAVEWDRLARSVVDLGLRALGSDRNVPGGSTLATQLEKFRHAPEGRTGSPADKLRQMGTASLRAYLDGPETLEDQRRIVREYLNSVPLAAQRGHGEVVGTADGLRAWYGTDFDEANRLLAAGEPAPDEADRQARVYRQALSLLLAHRRPTYYLARPEGRLALKELTDLYLTLLARDGVISAELARRAGRAEAVLLDRAPERPPPDFVERKAADQVRTHLLGLLGLPSLYELDRYDVAAHATLDLDWQAAAAELFRSLSDPAFVRGTGFGADRLLSVGDPGRVIYSFTLLESTSLGNVVRAQTDNYEGPLSLARGGRLELGSTAKLRTLVTYLEVVATLHGRLGGLTPDSLARVTVASQDRLTAWAVAFLRADPEASLATMLEAAMTRTYSANPGERFATGGGVQSFSNFDRTYDGRVMTVREAFRQSVNLPSIRTMRDVVRYHMFGLPGSTAGVLDDVDDPARQEYLVRFADREGREFLRQFYRKYQGRPGSEILDLLVAERALGPLRTAYAFRAVAPDASLETFGRSVDEHTPYSTLSDEALETLYRQSDPQRWDLNDLGFLSRIHPLELWLARYLLTHPGAPLQEVLDASVDVRQEVYQWLFRTRRRNAQDQRIRTILELEAFQEIHRSWRRLGYPFDNIVPSFGTAIGSSGDQPLALAELVGIIVNGGVRKPVVRVRGVEFAQGTPFETHMSREASAAERVMDPEVARVLREALVDVVENGTGRRVRGAITGGDGEALVVGGKTGTGDNRYRVFGAGGQLVESRAVNRTATLVFFVDDRWFGVVTAYVPGPEADRYRFTSALPSEVLRMLGPALSPMIAGDAGPVEGDEGN